MKNTDRNTLVSNVPNVNQNSAANMRIILDFNVQHKKFERLVQKHFPILKQDRVLGPVLPEHPQFIYRKAPSLRDKLAPGVIDPPVHFENRLRIGFLIFEQVLMNAAVVLPVSRLDVTPEN